MAFLRTEDQEKLRARFERDLVDDVRLVLFAQPPSGLFVPGRAESQTGRETQRLLEELAALSSRLHLEVHHPRADAELAARYNIDPSQHPAIVLLPGGPEAAQDGDTGTPAADGGAGAAAQTGGLVRFFGLPAGYEFATLIEDIVDLSSGKTRLSEGARDSLAQLPGPLHLQVFVTPT